MRTVLFAITMTLGFGGGFTTSLGDTYPYVVSAITTDSTGNTYVVGSRALGGGATFSASTGAAPPVVFTSPGGSDVFVAKLDPTGNVLFTDIFAGKGVDSGTAITLDPTGNIYIAGTTTSPDFPLSQPVLTAPSAYGTGFVMKLSSDGSTILYSTYYGGTLGATSITALATDAKGNLYLTGSTTATDFPHNNGLPFGQVQPGPVPITGAIFAAISAAGDRILYSGALVGTSLDCTMSATLCSTAPITTAGVGIGVDASGNAYIGVNTNTTDLPTTTGVLAPTGVGAFVAKVNAAGTALSYGTYLCSTKTLQTGTAAVVAGQSLSAIAVDAAGHVYLGGATDDPNFPTTPGAFQTTLNGPTLTTDGFLAELKPDGSGLVFGTFLGGESASNTNTSVESLFVDASGTVWATGTTNVSTFPNTNGWTAGPEFLASLNASGTALSYSALYPSGTVAQSVAVDPSGMIHVAGSTGVISTVSPTGTPAATVFAIQNAAGGSVGARISPAEVITIFGPGIGPSTPVSATPVKGFYPTALAGVQVAINGVNIPLLYVSANQINAVVPMATATNAAGTLQVINSMTTTPNYPVRVVSFAPEAFAPVLNADGTINSTTNPARSGSYVTFYATGWQSNFAPLTDGQVATAAEDACKGTCQVVPASNVQLPGATVLYGGAAPGIVAGVTQFNVSLGAIPVAVGATQFIFNLIGSSSVSQSLWVSP